MTCGKCGLTSPLDERGAHRKSCTGAKAPAPAAAEGQGVLDVAPVPKAADIDQLERYVVEFARSGLGRVASTDKKAYLLAAVERGLEVQGAQVPEVSVLEEFLSRVANHAPEVKRALGAGG